MTDRAYETPHPVSEPPRSAALPPHLLATLRRDIDEHVDLRVQQHLAAHPPAHTPLQERRAAPLLRAEHRLTLALVSLLVLLGFLIIDMIVAYGASTGVVAWLAAAGALVLLANLALSLRLIRH